MAAALVPAAVVAAAFAPVVTAAVLAALVGVAVVATVAPRPGVGVERRDRTDDCAARPGAAAC